MKIRKVLFVLMGAAILAASPSSRTFAETLSIPHFSQNNAAWTCNPLGGCANTTIGTCAQNTPAGCAITAGAMLLKFKGSNADPAKLNTYLKNTGGYENGGCIVKWERIASYDGNGGLFYAGTGSLTTPAALKVQIDDGQLVIAKSNRFDSHWGVIKGYRNTGSKWSDFLYLDPWDTLSTDRQLGDGWIGAGAATRIYR